MKSHTIFTRYSTPDLIGEANDAISGDGETSFDGQAAGSATTEIDIAFPYATLKSFCFKASGALTLNTNTSDGSGAGETVGVMPAGMTVWNANGIAANPFTKNVTKLYLVNAGSDPVTVKVSALFDSTP